MASPDSTSAAAARPPRRFDLKACRPVRSKKRKQAWALAHAFCFACGVDAHSAPWPGAAVHHIIRPGRSDEEANLIVLCAECHSLTHGANVRRKGKLLPHLSLGIQLNLKKLRDPRHWDPARLAQLWGRHLPELEAVPLLFLRAFVANRPGDRSIVAASLDHVDRYPETEPVK